VEALDAIYAPDARFKDPFNDVQGLTEIQRIFRHMYVSLENPHFVVTGRIVQGNQCFLTWEFRFGFQALQAGPAAVHSGRLAPGAGRGDGRITLHRDYWDAAQELYEKLPVVGGLMRWLNSGRANG
jgi:hypothetical protein